MLAAKMLALANELAEANALDFSLASLVKLEALVLAAKKRITPETTRTWGAYLGESIRRQATVPVEWVDHATAAAHNPTIAKLAPGYDIDAILRIGKTFWFPLSKVEKFQKNGKQDSLVAFAGVVLDMAAPKAKTPQPFDPADLEHASKALAELRKKPSAETLSAFSRAFTGNILREHYGKALQALALGVDELWRFMSVPASGRGYSRRDPGNTAASLIATLVETELAPRDAVLARARSEIAGKNKVSRENATYLVTHCELRAGSHGAFLEYAAHKSKELASGAWRALRTVTGAWRMKEYPQNIAMAPLVPVMLRALDGKSSQLGLALEALNDWQFDWGRRRDMALIVKPLIALLDHQKPSVAKDAERYLTNYLWAIVHGHAPADPAVFVLAKRKDKMGAEPLARLRDPSK